MIPEYKLAKIQEDSRFKDWIFLDYPERFRDYFAGKVLKEVQVYIYCEEIDYTEYFGKFNCENIVPISMDRNTYTTWMPVYAYKYENEDDVWNRILYVLTDWY